MNKQEVMAKVALNEKDTGSPEVQVALLTAHINELNEHGIDYHDNASQAIAEEDPESMTEEELEEDNLDYPDMEDDIPADEDVSTEFDIPEDGSEEDEEGELIAIQQMLNNLQKTSHMASVVAALRQGTASREAQREYMRALLEARGRRSDQ